MARYLLATDFRSGIVDTPMSEWTPEEITGREAPLRSNRSSCGRSWTTHRRTSPRWRPSSGRSVMRPRSGLRHGRIGLDHEGRPRREHLRLTADDDLERLTLVHDVALLVVCQMDSDLTIEEPQRE